MDVKKLGRGVRLWVVASGFEKALVAGFMNIVIQFGFHKIREFAEYQNTNTSTITTLLVG